MNLVKKILGLGTIFDLFELDIKALPNAFCIYQETRTNAEGKMARFKPLKRCLGTINH